MLVLSRRKSQKIICTVPEGIPAGSKIIITIVEIRGDKVRIGIDADRTVQVHRAEVQRLIDAEAAA